MAVETKDVERAGSARNPINGVAMELSLAEIKASKLNPRKTFDEAALQELADSLREQGMIEPLVLRKLGDDGYEIIAGERRWRAAQMAGLETVPVRVLSDIDDRRALELALVENLVRRDINPIEEAEGFVKLRELGWKVEEIASKVGRDESTVSNRTRLLELPDPIREKIGTGVLSASMGKALLQYAKVPKMMTALAALAEKGATTKAIEKCDYNSFDYKDWHTLPLKSLESYSGCKFDMESCAGCNLKRGRNCLDEDCWTKKNDEAAARLKEQIAAQAAEMHAGEFLTKGLEYRKDFVWLTSGLEGCSGDCEHRKTGVDQWNSRNLICTDPECHKRLEAEASAREAAKREVEFKAKMEKNLEVLADPEMLNRAAAVALYHSFRNNDSKALAHAAAVAGLTIELDWSVFNGYPSGPAEAWPILDAIASASVTDIIKLLAVEELLHDAEHRGFSKKSEWFQGQVLPEKLEVCDQCGEDIGKGSPDRVAYGDSCFCCEQCRNDYITEPCVRLAEPVLDAADIELVAYEDEDGRPYAICTTADEFEPKFYGIGTYYNGAWSWEEDADVSFKHGPGAIQAVIEDLRKLAEALELTEKPLIDLAPKTEAVANCRACGRDLSEVSQIIKHADQQFCSPGCVEGWQINQEAPAPAAESTQEQVCIQNCDECEVGCKCKGAFPSTPPPDQLREDVSSAGARFDMPQLGTTWELRNVDEEVVVACMGTHAVDQGVVVLEYLKNESKPHTVGKEFKWEIGGEMYPEPFEHYWRRLNLTRAEWLQQDKDSRQEHEASATEDFAVYLDAEVGGHELYVGTNPDATGEADQFCVLCRWMDRPDDPKPVWERELGRSVIHLSAFATIAETQSYLDSEAERLCYTRKPASVEDATKQAEVPAEDHSGSEATAIPTRQLRRYGDSVSGEETVVVVTGVANLGDKLIPTLRYLANSTKPEEVGREFTLTVFNDAPGLERFNRYWIPMSMSEEKYLASLPQVEAEQSTHDEQATSAAAGGEAASSGENAKTRVGFEDRTDSDVRVYHAGPNPNPKGSDDAYCVLMHTYPAAYSNPMFDISSESKPSLRWNDAFPTENEAQGYLEEIAAKNNWHWVELPFGQAPQETAGAES